MTKEEIIKPENLVYKKPTLMNDNPMHYCPGCSHGVVHKLIAEVIEEMGMEDKTIGVSPVGCAVFAYNYLDIDWQEAAHGRAPAVATAIKRLWPGRLVFTYQGDGDLALIGKPIKGRIIATRPGHTINNKFARQIRKEIKLHEIQAPSYNCNESPIMDVNRIRELLPHRYPFQLVDKVVAIGANHIVGVKNVTANEPFFQGHFPQEPVMPGVLQVEAMAQCGGLLVLNSVDEPERYSTYFMKIDGVKFRQKVVPGDTLLFRVELLAPIRRGISTMKGYVFVGEKVVCEAEFMAQIVKNK